MDKYLEAEKHLAELLGWECICESKFSCKPFEGTLDHLFGYIPRWTQDDAEAFKLMVEYEVNVEFYDFIRVSDKYDYSGDFSDHWPKDHVDKATAVRYAICQAVIMKLEVMK